VLPACPESLHRQQWTVWGSMPRNFTTRGGRIVENASARSGSLAAFRSTQAQMGFAGDHSRERWRHASSSRYLMIHAMIGVWLVKTFRSGNIAVGADEVGDLVRVAVGQPLQLALRTILRGSQD